MNEPLSYLNELKGNMTVGNRQVPAVICYTPTFDAYVRFGTHDIQIAKEIRRDYPLTFKDRTVLDIGAHIGLFSRYALQQGAKKVVSVEPDPGNISIFKLNVPKNNLLEGAIQSDILYTNNDGLNSGTFSVFGDPREPFIKVKSYNWQEILEDVKPDIIKIDVEGAEYLFLDGYDLPYAEELAIEIHLHRYNWREQAKKLIDSFSNWKTIVKPNISNRWQTIGVWKR